MKGRGCGISGGVTDEVEAEHVQQDGETVERVNRLRAARVALVLGAKLG